MSTLALIGCPLVFVAAFEVFTGVILLRRKARNDRVTKAVAAFSFFSAAFSLSVALMYLRSAAALPFNFFARFAWIGWFTIPAALQFVFYLRDNNSRRARAVGWVLYPFWAVMLGLCLFTDLIVTDHYELFPFENRPGPVENPARTVGGVLIVWLMVEIIRFRRLVTGIKRAQLNYFFHGTLIFGVLGSLAAAFLQLLDGFGFEPGLAAYFSFPWVALTFYAITRYRLFDIRIVISNTLSSVFLFALFAAVHVALFKFLEPQLGPVFAILISLSLIALLFFGTSFSGAAQMFIRRSVLKDRYVYQDVLRESIKAIVTILDFHELLDYIVDTIQKSLRAENVCLYLKEDGDGSYKLRHGAGGFAEALDGKTLDSGIADLVHQAGQSVVREELERILPEDAFSGPNRSLRDIGAELLVPLRCKGQLQGILTLGFKGNGEAYIQSDIDLLEALAGHAAVAIENARLYEEAKRVQESLKESEARFESMVEKTIQRYLSL